MKFNLTKYIISFLLIFSSFIYARVTAFPGAEGAGMYTIGGRGGDVYEVTNLNDSGPGSLREAIEASGPRTVVFRVSGTIALESDLKIKSPYITIAGQTAPGDGICIKDHTLYVNHNEVIIRYIRFRLGDESGVESDATWGRYCKSVILDHCSASWSVDEGLSYYGIDSLTVQWCLISESLYNSNHSKGAHGYGGIWGGEDASFHHNLFAHHSSRNPRFAGGQTSTCKNVDYRNNVIYNWGFNSAYGGEAGTINMIANYYKSGPATKSSVKYRICEPSGTAGRWYIKDNYVVGSPNITNDNWAGGVQGSSAVKSIIGVDEPFPFTTVTTQTAEEAFLSVLADVGATLPARDPIDARIISEVESGTATFEGPGYEEIQNLSDTSIIRGIIDSQNDVGGWPVLSSLAAPVDSDHDGIPDDWELKNNLNPNDDTDRNIVDDNGYTMLENYINSLVPNSTTDIREATVPTSLVLLRNYPNPFNPVTTISFSIPTPDYISLGIYDVRGRLVKKLSEGFHNNGAYELNWNGTNENNVQVSSGLYFAYLRYGKSSKIIKMQLIR